MTKKSGSPSMAQVGKAVSDKLLSQKSKLQQKGLLAPEASKKMTMVAAQAVEMGTQSENKVKAALEQFGAARKKIAKVKAGEIPAELKKRFAAKGMDLEQMKKLSREEVQTRYEQGLSLVGFNLSEVDLSGMNLVGVDLSKANCRKTIFTKCNLQGARLNQTMAQEADFSEADLGSSMIDQALLNKAKFTKAHLDKCEVQKTVMKEADFSEASFEHAVINMSVLEKTNLYKANFKKAQVELSVFSDAKATEATFSGAVLKKCLLKRTVLDKANFAGSSFPSTCCMARREKDSVSKGLISLKVAWQEKLSSLVLISPVLSWTREVCLIVISRGLIFQVPISIHPS